MARIPDAMGLGERVQPRTSGGSYIGRAGEIAGAGLAETAATIGDATRRFAQQDDAFNFARARHALLTSQAGVAKQLEEDQDWQSHETRYGETMKVAREEAAKLIRGGRSKALFEQEAEADILRGAEAVRGNARRLEGQWGRGELDNVLAGNRKAALESKDPALRDQLVLGTLDAIKGARAKGYITPEQESNARQAWTANYGEGVVAMLPDGEQLKMLRKPKGTPADYIDPEKRAILIDHLENKMRVDADRREAKAERVYNQWERQISSGVPLTPEMRSAWSKMIAGTSFQGELDNLLAGEKEIQDTLRKPIGEQIRLVQQKDAALKEKGGTLAEAANVERLKKAVQNNVTMLQTSPLTFAEQRMESPVVPLQVAAIMEPDSQAAIAVEMQDRAAQIRVLEKRFGSRVPMKPLLPQEAAELAAMLENASPKESADLFAALSNASGTPDVFKGAVGQIAPDAPVKAMAGLLSAKQRTLVTDSSMWWFVPDKTIASQDVAGTLLRGESILNPTKGEKAEDGRSKAAQMYLPSAAKADLQSKFEKVVGDAFAGRPRAADNALQAAQAYYVGRAAELGKIAGDAQTADADLVRESVRATMGAVVDYNGNGDVFPPWGMSEDDFEDRAERALAAELKRRGLDPEMAPAFGLTNTSEDGVYALTKGHNVKKDENDMPITISLKPPERTGYIDRSQ